ENKGKRSLAAGFIFVVANFVLNLVFVKTMRLESFGIALSSSIGMWVIMLAEIQYFFSGSSSLKVSLHPTSIVKEGGKILAIGFPGAATNIYQTLRGLIVNGLLSTYVGSMGISAFAGANNVMGIFWAIPGGMLAVSRLLISVSAGEEDRQTLSDIIRIMFTRYLPIMLGVDLLIILAAPYLTMIFFRDPSVPVYGMMVDGLRILPLCMCFSIICMHFTCLGQAFGKQGFVNILALLDGVVCVAGFSFLLIAVLQVGIKGVYIANVLNGVVTTLYILGYAWKRNGHFPQDLEELMVLPSDFGVTEEERIDVSVRTMDDVVTVSDQIQTFCKERGIDEKRSYLAGLAMEEMAGNVVAHGFHKDAKKHSVDIRVVHKNDRVILRIKDDCVPFDPKERRQLLEGDILKNIGIRMIYDLVKDIDYQNMLGLNVLTMTI
ncbi:MAG: ATP-binding protein, partial [Erysipelotrichaceae bacterium]|nr:ATP-binding protein [Erysipelotrichaceae bacterium]